MPKFTYTEEENERFELLKNGDYPCEVVSYDSDLSKSSKTRGCSQISLAFRFYEDSKFEKPVAQWTETLTIPDVMSLAKDTARFLAGRLNMFAKSFNIAVKKGEEIEFDELTVLGLRGWCHVTREPRQTKDQGGNYVAMMGEDNKPVFRNKVDYFPTDKARLERAPRQPEVDETPF